MTSIPRDPALDSTLALLAEGYTFIARRCQRYQTDLFETRLMLRKTVCVLGQEASRMFYEPDRFTRKGAMPGTTLRLLQDEGSVALLDGDAHRQRKQMFMSLMSPAEMQRLVDVTADLWRARLEKWETRDQVVLHDAILAILARAVCAWAGVPLTPADAGLRTREFAAMIDGAGVIGPRNWWGTLLRARTERWMRAIVAQVRNGDLEIAPRSAAHTIIWHRDLGGELLDAEVAVVELLNVLRPTVAVARFVTFAALALHEHPEWRQRLQGGSDEELTLFVQEVRRFYPFFPFVAGQVRDAFDWNDHRFTAGTLVLLDLYGTDHDARIWENPDAFRPERFRDWDGSAFNFIPQGGGDFHNGHRCPGEWITIELMKGAVRLLTSEMRYDVPEQDLHIDLSRMPTLPRSRFVITNVGRTSETAAAAPASEPASITR